MNIEDFLDAVEADIVARLAGDSWFGQARLNTDGSYVAIPVIAEELGDIDVSITKAVASEAGPGICLIVKALEWNIRYENVPGPYIEQLDIVLLGIENVPLNRGTIDSPSPSGTLKKLKSTMIRAQELLHLWTPPTLTRALVCKDTKLQRVGSESDGDAGIIQYTTMITGAGGTGIVGIPQVATPIVVSDNGNPPTITMSCVTPGACICYRTDGSLPSPMNGNIYTGPFIAQTGQKITANAWLTYFPTSASVALQL